MACRKLARFTRLCDAFRLPLIVVHDRLAPFDPIDDGLRAAVAMLAGDLADATTTIISLALGADSLESAMGVSPTVALGWSREVTPVDERVDPARTRSAIARILVDVPPTRLPAWEDPRVNREQRGNLFSRTR